MTPSKTAKDTIDTGTECPSFKYKDFQVGAKVTIKDNHTAITPSTYMARAYKIKSVCLHTCTAELDVGTRYHLDRLELVDKPKEPGLVFINEKDSSALDTQVGGTHYTDLGLQPFEATYRNFGYMGLKASVYTKVNKYLTRDKDDELAQLKKAKHCLEVLIEYKEAELTECSE